RSDYTNVNLSQFIRKLPRLQKLIVEAAKQSKSMRLPTIEDTLDLDEVLDFGLKDIYVMSTELPGMRFVQLDKPQNEEINLLIGPEGGFSEREVEMMKKNDSLRFISFGQNILRSETAV